MTISDTARDLCGSGNGTFTAKRRRQAGTSLVEILVVIVIFLIGILAVVQVFPRGFRLLLTTRNNSVATALGRDEIERGKANPAALPDEVLPVRYVGTTPMVDNTINPLSLGPLGDSLDGTGNLKKGGASPGIDWELASGANVARRIIGEGARVPAPRTVGDLYGGLLVLEHGPVAPNSPIVAYANEMSRTSGPPVEAAPDGTAYSGAEARSPDGSTTLGSVAAYNVKTPATTFGAFEYFVVDAGTDQASLLIPTNQFDRLYRVRLSGYAGTAGNGYARTDWVSLSLFVPARPQTGYYPLVQVKIGDLLAASNVLGGNSFAGVEVDTVRVAPQYMKVAKPTSSADLALWNADPFRMVVADPTLGTLVFAPAAREGVVTRPGGGSEPLLAKVDYDVYDWRVIREDFRDTGTPTFALALQSLKVGTSTGPDGRTNNGIFGLGALKALDPPQSPRDNLMVMDLTTGFLVQKYNAGSSVDDPLGADANQTYVTVDKSRGLVTLKGNSLGKLTLMPPSAIGGGNLTVDPANRTFRIFYRARDEWSVQIVKSASQYSLVSSLGSNGLEPGKCILGGGSLGGSKTRLYFPLSDVGRKITIDRIVYNAGAAVRTLEGQDFVIQPPVNVPSLGFIDVASIDPGATGFAVSLDPPTNSRLVDPVRGVKGASVSVRTLWNPETFSLTSDSATNLARLDQWGRGWRKSTTETYLRAEETR